MDKLKKRNKIQTVMTSIPAAGLANQVYGPAAQFTPDQTYKNIIAVWIKVLSQSTAQYILVQLSDAFNVKIDPSHSDLFSTGDAAASKDKWMPIDPIKCDGQAVVPGIKAPNSPAGQVDVLWHFMLSDDDIEVVNQ